MYKFFLKRMFDLVLVIIALPFWIIILTIIGIAIFIEDRGPIFYNAPRLGKNGEVFIMYKLRSMRTDAPDIRNSDGSTFNSPNDERLTKVGRFLRKTSLDEMPQVVNVLKNEMSIIGPRPDLPEHRELYQGNDERKLELKPGITGLNQAYYRNTIPWKERIQNDIYYIDHISFWLDLKILIKTVASVVRCKNIFVPPSDSPEIKDSKVNVEV